MRKFICLNIVLMLFSCIENKPEIENQEEHKTIGNPLTSSFDYLPTSTTNRIYKKSGYNKGHLCPAGDRKSSYSAYKETFYTSNISPQLYEFNAGIWNRLEEKTRYWAEKYDGIYVITGGVLSNDLETIGKEEVSVPKYFYKILITKDGTKMIGFLVPHEASEKPLYEFVVSVDEIEKRTGIDFFPKLDNNIEKTLESATEYKKWSF